MARIRSLLNKKVKVGDVLNSPGERDSRFKHVVVKLDRDEGLVQFAGDDRHWYSTDNLVHVHGKDKRMMRRVYAGYFEEKE
jgi:hypothetical protein